jgi:hypothetical protein
VKPRIHKVGGQWQSERPRMGFSPLPDVRPHPSHAEALKSFERPRMGTAGGGIVTEIGWTVDDATVVARDDPAAG